MICYISQIEEQIAVLEKENGEIFHVDISLLPDGCKESDVVELINGQYIYSEEKTVSRKKSMAELLNKIITKK